jgi:cellulose synthase/poly-beta-1,6-N-acetylglucosamine synthase-like glycosyltransferase
VKLLRPDVSVLLPVYNGGPHLYEAMSSLVSQRHKDYEIIVVDDGSTDDTPAQLEAWIRRDTRVRVISQAHAGIVAALETARAAATGRYLARMDADDIAEPDRLSEQFSLMEASPDLVGCGCGVEYFPSDAVQDGARRYETWMNALVTPDAIAAAIFVECPLAHPTFFLRTEAVAAVGGYVDRGWPEDYDLVLRLWKAGGRLGKVPGIFHRWRERPERLSRTGEQYSPSSFLSCKVHYLRRTLLTDDRGAVIWGAGPVGKTFARALIAEGTRIEAFVELDPRKIGQVIHGAPVFDPSTALERYEGVAGGARSPLHLAAVGQPGARSRIVEQLTEAGYSVLDDFVPVA